MNIAIIPARGGSKSIPKKNLALVGGKSLLERAINCAQLAGVEYVFVSTDDREIAAAAVKSGAEVITRPEKFSGDRSSSESALLHAIHEIEKDINTSDANIAFLQATSPFTNPNDLKKALKLLKPEKSIFAAIEFHNFLWIEKSSSWFPKGHKSNFRKMKEQLHFTAMETGNFYCFPVSTFIKQKTRFCGDVFPFFVDPITTLQIDSPGELIAAQKLAAVLDSY